MLSMMLRYAKLDAGVTVSDACHMRNTKLRFVSFRFAFQEFCVLTVITPDHHTSSTSQSCRRHEILVHWTSTNSKWNFHETNIKPTRNTLKHLYNLFIIYLESCIQYMCVCGEHLKTCKTSTFVKVSLYMFIYFKIFLHFIYSFSSQAQISFSLGRLVRFRFFFSKQGVPGIIASLALTKTLALICDIRKGRLSDVPANLFLWWEEAQPKNLYVDFQTSFQTKPEFLPVRFSQSDSLPMSSRRNSCLSCIRT